MAINFSDPNTIYKLSRGIQPDTPAWDAPENNPQNPNGPIDINMGGTPNVAAAQSATATPTGAPISADAFESNTSSDTVGKGPGAPGYGVPLWLFKVISRGQVHSYPELLSLAKTAGVITNDQNGENYLLNAAKTYFSDTQPADTPQGKSMMTADDFLQFQKDMVGKGGLAAEDPNELASWAATHNKIPVIKGALNGTAANTVFSNRSAANLANAFTYDFGSNSYGAGTGTSGTTPTSPANHNCPSGTTWNEQQQSCVPIGSDTPTPSAGTCTAGQYWDNDLQKCLNSPGNNPGSQYTTRNDCRTKGYYWDDAGQKCDTSKNPNGTAYNPTNPSGANPGTVNTGPTTTITGPTTNVTGGATNVGGTNVGGTTNNVSVGSSSLEQYARYVDYLDSQLREGKTLDQIKAIIAAQTASGNITGANLSYVDDTGKTVNVDIPGSGLTVQEKQRMQDDIFNQVTALQNQAKQTGFITPITSWGTDPNGIPVPKYGQPVATTDYIAQLQANQNNISDRTGYIRTFIGMSNTPDSSNGRVSQKVGTDNNGKDIYAIYEAPKQTQQSINDAYARAAAQAAITGHYVDPYAGDNAAMNGAANGTNGTQNGTQTEAGREYDLSLAQQQAQLGVTRELGLSNLDLQRAQQAAQLAANPRNWIESLYYNTYAPQYQAPTGNGGATGGTATPQIGNGSATGGNATPQIGDTIVSNGQAIATSPLYSAFTGQTAGQAPSFGVPDNSPFTNPQGATGGTSGSSLIQNNTSLPGVNLPHQANYQAYRAMSPTQQQIFMSLVSAQGIDPNDYIDGMQKGQPNAGTASFNSRFDTTGTHYVR